MPIPRAEDIQKYTTSKSSDYKKSFIKKVEKLFDGYMNNLLSNNGECVLDYEILKKYDLNGDEDDICDYMRTLGYFSFERMSNCGAGAYSLDYSVPERVISTIAEKN